MKWLLVLPLIWTAGCRSTIPPKSKADYVKTVESARHVIETAVQMEQLFRTADHFITEYGFKSGPRIWNTEVYFGGRYRLTMQVEIEIDYNRDRIIRTLTEPQFHLTEVGKIEVLADGRVYSENVKKPGQETFGLPEWRRVFAAGGDWSVIGFTIDKSSVQHFDEFVEAWRRPRIAVSLIDEHE